MIVSATQSIDSYFGGVHALAYENSVWTGAADPRRDGTVAIATVERVTSNSLHWKKIEN
jgi:gamma-glutamyltranspeptidase